MLILLSPAKSLDFSATNLAERTEILFPKETQQLASLLKKKSAADIAELMDLSDKLAQLNYERYQQFSKIYSLENAKPALAAFDGDVYQSMEEAEYSAEEWDFAQKHLRILSGLYGLLRPLDAIQPYRLEMGTSLENKQGKNLYAFWGDKITRLLAAQAKEMGTNLLLNLASQEYFAAVNTAKWKGKILHIHFKEKRNEKWQIIALNAKRARGLMANFIIRNQITDPELLKAFDLAGYSFRPELSSEGEWTFGVER